MKIAVTGGEGYLGAIIVQSLQKDHTVIAMTHGTGCNQFSLGISTDFDGFKPDCVIHCAFQPISHTSKDIKGDINAVGMNMLLTDCERTGVERFILLSSKSAEGNPKSDYGKVKAYCENLISNRKKSFVIRLGLVIDEKKGGFVGAITSFANKFSYIPLPIPKNLRLHQTQISEILNEIENILNRREDSSGISFCYSASSISLRDFINQNSKRRCRRFIPINIKMLYFGVMIFRILSPRTKIYPDSVKTFF